MRVLQEGSDTRNQMSRECQFGGGRQRLSTVVVKQNQGVRVATEAVLNEISHDQRNILGSTFLFCIFRQIIRFGGKPNAQRGVGERRHVGENVGVLYELDDRWRCTVLFGLPG